jgi:alpha-galactosidase
MKHHKTLFSWAAVLIGGLVLTAALGQLNAMEPVALASVDDAFVAQQDGGWVVGSAAIGLHIGFVAATGSLEITGVQRPGSDAIWASGGSPDLSLRIQSRRVSPGQTGLVFRQARTSTEDGAARLDVDFEDTATRLRVTRSFAARPGSAGVELWTTYAAEASQPAVSLSDIGIWQLAIPAETVSWITGLSAPAAEGGTFTRRTQALGAGSSLTIGSPRRSSELAIPAVWLTHAEGSLLGGLMWSGEWRLTVSEADSSGRVVARMSLGDTATTVRQGQPFETPHGVLGVSGPGELALSAAWQAFIRNDLRRGRPFDALVTHNTWFAHGNRIDEETVRDEMDRAAALGVELFVLDAGWYPGGTQADDFTTGLGLWTVDSRRFPSGLRALRDYAHALGLRFGIWVEPERVDTSTINRSGLARERFLATSGGRYNAGVRNESASAAQVCLGDEEAKQWVLGQLTRFLDDVAPDYLKWDNNYWINCDRSGHGHGEADGNLAHVKGLYGILAALRARYPDLSIEDCASGGNRLDLGMLQYTDAGWMDDVSAPSTHVRHNLEALLAVFPPAYLLSFVMDDPDEPVHRADLESIVRSRAPGVLGFSLRPEEFSEAELLTMRREIFDYKRRRDILREGLPILLAPQVPAGGSLETDAVQIVSGVTGDAAIYAFAGSGRSLDRTIWPLSLDPDALYLTPGRRGMALGTGAGLMSSGIGLPPSREASSAIIVITRRSP